MSYHANVQPPTTAPKPTVTATLNRILLIPSIPIMSILNAAPLPVPFPVILVEFVPEVKLPDGYLDPLSPLSPLAPLVPDNNSLVPLDVVVNG